MQASNVPLRIHAFPSTFLTNAVIQPTYQTPNLDPQTAANVTRLIETASQDVRGSLANPTLNGGTGGIANLSDSKGVHQRSGERSNSKNFLSIKGLELKQIGSLLIPGTLLWSHLSGDLVRLIGVISKGEIKEEEAKDLAQNILRNFLKSYAFNPDVITEKSVLISTLLMKMTINEVLGHIRVRSRYLSKASPLENMSREEQWPEKNERNSPLTRVLVMEFYSLLNEALSHIKIKFRTPLVMALLGFKPPEIAKILGRKESTIKVQITRAKNELKRRLRAKGIGPGWTPQSNLSGNNERPSAARETATKILPIIAFAALALGVLSLVSGNPHQGGAALAMGMFLGGPGDRMPPWFRKWIEKMSAKMTTLFRSHPDILDENPNPGPQESFDAGERPNPSVPAQKQLERITPQAIPTKSEDSWRSLQIGEAALLNLEDSRRCAVQMGNLVLEFDKDADGRIHLWVGHHEVILYQLGTVAGIKIQNSTQRAPYLLGYDSDKKSLSVGLMVNEGVVTIAEIQMDYPRMSERHAILRYEEPFLMIEPAPPAVGGRIPHMAVRGNDLVIGHESLEEKRRQSRLSELMDPLRRKLSSEAWNQWMVLADLLDENQVQAGEGECFRARLTDILEQDRLFVEQMDRQIKEGADPDAHGALKRFDIELYRENVRMRVESLKFARKKMLEKYARFILARCVPSWAREFVESEAREFILVKVDDRSRTVSLKSAEELANWFEPYFGDLPDPEKAEAVAIAVNLIKIDWSLFSGMWNKKEFGRQSAQSAFLAYLHEKRGNAVVIAQEEPELFDFRPSQGESEDRDSPPSPAGASLTLLLLQAGRRWDLWPHMRDETIQRWGMRGQVIEMLAFGWVPYLALGHSSSPGLMAAVVGVHYPLLLLAGHRPREGWLPFVAPLALLGYSLPPSQAIPPLPLVLASAIQLALDFWLIYLRPAASRSGRSTKAPVRFKFPRGNWVYALGTAAALLFAFPNLGLSQALPWPEDYQPLVLSPVQVLLNFLIGFLFGVAFVSRFFKLIGLRRVHLKAAIDSKDANRARGFIHNAQSKLNVEFARQINRLNNFLDDPEGLEANLRILSKWANEHDVKGIEFDLLPDPLQMAITEGLARNLINQNKGDPLSRVVDRIFPPRPEPKSRFNLFRIGRAA